MSILILSFSLSLLKGQAFVPGTSYFSSDNYVEYIAGNLPLIISVPHGGELEPQNIPDRNCGGCVYVKDSYTQELGREIQQSIVSKIGCSPHLVVNLLHRKKLDANRSIGDAADGNPDAEAAWNHYHAFIDSAKQILMQDFGKGLFLDFHGHGHDIQRLELGYLLSRSELQQSNTQLNDSIFRNESSIRHLANNTESPAPFSQILRGSNSFGALVEDKNYPSVPSDLDPFPIGSEPYFSGGYNTDRYGSADGGSIDAIQIECNQEVRFVETDRKKFADSLATAILSFLEIHYFPDLLQNPCNAVSIEEEIDFQWELYPNPAQDVLYIRTDLPDFEIRIINNLGQIVGD
ncbi:MAG: hypothetical protein AAF696_33660, partial [Bacteroidota bacterium]